MNELMKRYLPRPRALPTAVQESFNVTLAAYTEYDAQSSALMSGDTRRLKGKDMVRVFCALLQWI